MFRIAYRLRFRWMDWAMMRAAFDLAADAGYAGIAFATNQPELRPADLGASARRHLQRILASKNLRIDALRIAGPRGGLADSASVERAIENARKGIALAFDMGIKTISVNAGALAGEAAKNDSIYAAARQIAEDADRAGVIVAFAADGSAALEQLISHLAWDRACANLETAREIAGGHDPVEVLQKFRGAVAQVTLADAISRGSASTCGGSWPWPALNYQHCFAVF